MQLTGRSKGKIERPFLEMKEAFLQEIEATGPPATIDELNRRAANWLEAYVHSRPHRTTKVAPNELFKEELTLLGPLPRSRFDTARRESRRVGQAVPLIEVDAVFYSVSPTLAGMVVEIKLPVDRGIIEVYHQGQFHVAHEIAPTGSVPIWDPGHRRQAEELALSRHDRSRKQMRLPQSQPAGQLELGYRDYDVAAPRLADFDPDRLGCGCGIGGEA
ncbi:MAG: Mu transposase domain-containing protein [Actinomycetota bacterium]